MPQNLLPLVVPFVVGVALGCFHFGGLWWTVRRMAGMRYPWLLLWASFLVRSVVTVGGFLLVADSGWERIVACVVGFLLARSVLIRCIRPAFDRSGKGVN